MVTFLRTNRKCASPVSFSKFYWLGFQGIVHKLHDKMVPRRITARYRLISFSFSEKRGCEMDFNPSSVVSLVMKSISGRRGEGKYSGGFNKAVIDVSMLVPGECCNRIIVRRCEFFCPKSLAHALQKAVN